MAKKAILVTGGTAAEQLGYEADHPLDRALADYVLTLRKLEGL